MNEQSTSEFLNKLAEGPRLAVITLSPQSRAALAAHFQISLAMVLSAAPDPDPPHTDGSVHSVNLPWQVACKLKTFLGTLGVHHVLDSSCAGDITLHEVRRGAFILRWFLIIFAYSMRVVAAGRHRVCRTLSG